MCSIERLRYGAAFFAAVCTLAVLGGCSFIEAYLKPPYAFTNSKDPYLSWGAAESRGKTFLSDRVGIPLLQDFAVTRDGRYAFAGSGYESGLVKMDLSSGSAIQITGTTGGFNAICVSPGSDYVYATVSRNTIVRMDLQTNAMSTIVTLPNGTSNSGTEFASTIAIDENNVLHTIVYTWSNSSTGSNGSISVKYYSNTGALLGAYALPTTNNDFRSLRLAVSSQYLFVADRNGQSVILLDKNTGQTVRQIYFDGSQYRTVTLNGSAPQSYGNGFYPIDISLGVPGTAYDPAGTKVTVFSNAYPVVRVFDTANLSAPYVSGFGAREDYGDPFSCQIDMDGNGKVYVQDTLLGYLVDAQTGDVLNVNPSRQAGEFINVQDICRNASGSFFIADNSLWQLTSFAPSTGAFKLFGTVGYASGSLYYPNVLAAKEDDLFCARDDPPRLLRFGADGSFLQEITPTVIGQWDPLKMIFLADGRLLTWNSEGFHVYDAGFVDTRGSFKPTTLFDNVSGVALGKTADGRILCAYSTNGSNNSGFTTSIGILSATLDSYSEMWNSGTSSWFQNPVDIGGIVEDLQGRIWLNIRTLGAAVCITPQGSLLGSLCTLRNPGVTKTWQAATLFNFGWSDAWGPVIDSNGDLYFIQANQLTRYTIQ